MFCGTLLMSIILLNTKGLYTIKKLVFQGCAEKGICRNYVNVYFEVAEFSI